MRKYFILILLIILPIFASAQSNMNRMKMPQRPNFNNSAKFYIQDMQTPESEKHPKTPQLETVKPLSYTKIQHAQNKLAREEQKLIKLAEKKWTIEADLKAKQKSLQLLENDTTKNNDTDIEKAKKEITKSQDELNKAKTDVELSSKKVEELEKAIEAAKFTRHGD